MIVDEGIVCELARFGYLIVEYNERYILVIAEREEDMYVFQCGLRDITRIEDILNADYVTLHNRAALFRWRN